VTVEPKLEATTQPEPEKTAKPITNARHSPNLWWVLLVLLLAMLVIIWLLIRRSKRHDDVEQSGQIEDAGNTEQPTRTPIR